MSIESSIGVVIGISVALPATDDAAGYEALTFTPIGEIEDGGTFGASQDEINFTGLADGVVRKLKGAINYGSAALTVGTDMSDAGQALLLAASEDVTNTRRAYQYLYPNGDADYFQALAFGFDKQVGAAGNVIKSSVNLGVNTKPIYTTA